MSKKGIFKNLKMITPPVVYNMAECIYRSINKPIDSCDIFSGKVFCIGFNKTCTTSVERVLRDFGYRLGNYGIAVMMMYDWHRGDFRRLIEFCKTAQAFQDIPFSLPGTYQHLDAAFPGSKFILTIRDSKDQWFQSLTRYHTKRYSSDKSRLPTENDLMTYSDYPYYGFILDIMKMEFGYPEVRLYDRDHYTQLYCSHIRDVQKHFQDREDTLLVLNVSESNAYQKLASFLNVKVPDGNEFPWKNKT